VNNLREEGIIHHEEPTLSFDCQGVYHCGDVMYDNTLFFREAALKQSTILKELDLDRKPYMLATIHRPVNTDVKENLLGILSALEKVAEEHRIPVILPMHPRTRNILNQEDRTDESGTAASEGLVRFIPAVSFLDMVRLEAGARVILTDSGGVQKEAWFMEKPVVVLREETEWVEIIEAGNGILAGADSQRIIKAARKFMEAPPAIYPPIFGDGQAARNILKVITTARWY
jgi:UDP-GlcNAc3NAcA epimerase